MLNISSFGGRQSDREDASDAIILAGRPEPAADFSAGAWRVATQPHSPLTVAAFGLSERESMGDTHFRADQFLNMGKNPRPWPPPPWSLPTGKC